MTWLAKAPDLLKQPAQCRFEHIASDVTNMWIHASNASYFDAIASGHTNIDLYASVLAKMGEFAGNEV